MQLLRHIALFIFFFSHLLVSPIFASGEDEGKTSGEKKDTIKAVVVYGDDFLLQPTDRIPQTSLTDLVDSILNLDSVPSQLIEELNFLSLLPSKSEVELQNLVDSLLGMNPAPYALVNEINWYLSQLPSSYPFSDRFLMIPYDSAIYPANYYYGDWNTAHPNPYRRELVERDTTIELQLTDEQLFCDYQHPCDGPVTSKFGIRNGRRHNGVDIDLEVWDPVKASFSGMVRVAKYYGGYGRVVVIRHYNGLETLYAHLHRLKVRPGQFVEAGEVIGLGGSSGKSTGSHLHFEVRFKGIAINPAQMIDFKTKDLISESVVLRKGRWGYGVQPKGVQYHTVKRGEYLKKIAEDYGIPLQKLCEINGISRKRYLRVGQKLRVSI